MHWTDGGLVILAVWIGIVVPPFGPVTKEKVTVMWIGIVLVIWFVDMTTVNILIPIGRLLL